MFVCSNICSFVVLFDYSFKQLNNQTFVRCKSRKGSGCE
nr:MAG TPA: hypothetical protein [Caudoviricetes sp.]